MRDLRAGVETAYYQVYAGRRADRRSTRENIANLKQVVNVTQSNTREVRRPNLISSVPSWLSSRLSCSSASTKPTD